MRNKTKFERTLRIIAWPAFSKKKNNPYQFLLYKHLAFYGVQTFEATPATLLLRRCDIFHVHWPDFLIGSKTLPNAMARVAAMVALMAFLKLRGTRIVWTVHNLTPHEIRHEFLSNLYWRIFVLMLNGCISMSEGASSAAICHFPRLGKIPHVIIPHGNYRGYYKNSVTRSEARNRLQINAQAKVVLFFGMIRPYKNITDLIKAFKSINNNSHRLVTAGASPDSSLNTRYTEILQNLTKEDSRILLHLRHIKDDDVQIYFNACDLVVIPFKTILNSGSALLALSFSKPILVPDTATMRDLQEKFGPEWVHLFQNDLNGENIVGVLAATGQIERLCPMRGTQWSDISRATFEFFQKLQHHDRTS